MQGKRLVLASGSPRRKELLAGLGVTFDIVVSDVDETITDPTDPVEVVQELAYRKARAVANTLSDALVIGADTIVVHEGTILGKPQDEADAKRMLRQLSGQTHTVYTGLALIETTSDGGEARVVRDVCGTQVVMKELTDETIARYVATGEPSDKAGAYAVQGLAAQFVTELHGDYFNVVGLPLATLSDHLTAFGWELLPPASSGR
ncbi:MAG TPA: Maf family protein [Bacilli bacterium]|nr:Maf family protein [Bacilli bacterium]